MIENLIGLFRREKIDLSHKRVMVMGATRGIGKAIATEFALQGAHKIIVHGKRQLDRALDWQRALRESHQNIGPDQFKNIMCDIGDMNNIDRMVSTLAHDSGGLDYLVLNVAAGLERDGGGEKLARIINIDAQVNFLKRALENGLLRPGAKVIYITSHIARNYDPHKPLIVEEGNPTPTQLKMQEVTKQLQKEDDKIDWQQKLKKAFEFLGNYEDLIAQSKHQGEKELFSTEILKLLKNHNVTLSIVSGPFVSDTVPYNYLKAKQYLRLFVPIFGETTPQKMADGVMRIVNNPHTHTGDVVNVLPEFAKKMPPWETATIFARGLLGWGRIMNVR